MDTYKISSHCRYVKGAYASAIYDLHNKAVFSLNKDATTILDKALEGKVTEEMTEFLSELCNKQFLNCDSIETISDTCNTPELRYVWLELTNRCNCRCLHCYGAFGAPKKQDLEKELTTAEWKKILDRLKELDCKAIQLIGGEPLICKDFCEILEYAHDIGIYGIDIFTNGTLLTPEVLDCIKRTHANVRVSLYGYDSESHDRITQHKGSFEKLDKSLDMLKQMEIPTKIAVVIMQENQNDLSKIYQYIIDKGYEFTGFDIVRRVRHSEQLSHAVTDERVINYKCKTKPAFHTSCTDFCRNTKWNSCWFGKFAITASGDIIPCIYARDNICGNIRVNDEEYIKNNLLKYWNIGKDKVETCKDCEYRYACDDCRPLADGETGDMYARSPRCLYNPYTGEWNKQSKS